MEKQIFSLYDKKAEAYTSPFFMNQEGQALRALDGIVNDEKTQVCLYPEDFTLYKLGVFDDVSGKLISLDNPKHIAEAIIFKKAKENESG